MNERFIDAVWHLQERLEEILIPRLVVPAGRKPHIVQYLISKKLHAIVRQRYSMFERVYSVNVHIANKLLDAGYKLLSRFGRWCPVVVCHSFIHRDLDKDATLKATAATEDLLLVA